MVTPVLGEVVCVCVRERERGDWLDDSTLTWPLILQQQLQRLQCVQVKRRRVLQWML